MPYDWFVTDGTQLALKINNVFTNVPGVQNLDGPSGTKTEIEGTALSDTAKSFKGGKPDYGSVTFDLAWDPADTTHAAILDSYKTAGSVDDWQITFPDAGAAAAAFSGAVMEFAWKLAKDSPGLVSVRVKCSGEVTVTP